MGPAAATDQPAPERALGLPHRRAFAVHPRPGCHARGGPVGALPVPEPAAGALHRRARRADPVRGAGRRDAADRGPPPRRRPRAVRPLLRRTVPDRLPRPGRPAPARRQEPDPRGPLAAGHRARAGAADRRAAPGAGLGAGARPFRGRRGDRPPVGLVPGVQAPARRRDDARVGARPPAAAVGRVHGRQPRLRPARRVPDRRVDGAGRRRAAAALRVRVRTWADALRVRGRRARDVPDRPAVHVPARLPAPDGPGDRPRPRRGVRPVDPGGVRRRVAGRPAGVVRRPRRVLAAAPGRAVGAGRTGVGVAVSGRRDRDPGRR